MIELDYPDRTVYHHGSLFDGVAPSHLGPYATKAGTQVPAHWWNARVVDFKEPLTLKKSPADIIAANQMFPFGDTGARINTVPTYNFSGPMDSAGVTTYMPTTGERPDIGMICDPSALFMLTGKPESMLAWARANDSCPMHFRDENTGKPVDLIKYPAANVYQGNQGSPRFRLGPPSPTSNGYDEYGGGWTPQQAHYCEMGSYLSFLSTLNPHFLENVQYNANFMFLGDAYLSGGRKIATIYGEPRGVSWSLRNLFMAHSATKYAESLGILPNSCHPSAYWKQLLDNQLSYFTATYKNDPNNQAYRLISGGNRFGPWQVDYGLTALAFGVLTGHSDWVPFYLWALKNAIDRTSGKSGWPVGWGGAYYLNTHEWGKNPDGTFDQGKYDTSKPLDWYGTFLFQQNDPNGARPTAAQIASLAADPYNGGKAIVGNEYLMTTRAVLVMAAYLEKKGLLDVRSAYPDLDLCIANVDRMTRAYGSMNARVSVVLDASSAPSDLPPIPVPDPTPTPDPTPDPVPTPTEYPKTVHGLYLRAQEILKRV